MNSTTTHKGIHKMNKDMRDFYMFKLKAYFMVELGVEEGLAQGLAFIAIDFPEKQIIKILED